MNSKLTHFNTSGDAHMVDVGDKSSTHRVAIAEGWIGMQAETLQLIKSGESKKGDVLAVARVAAIMASKKTGELIPLCHPISLTHVEVRFSIDKENQRVHCEVQTETRGQTGVEMEALTSVQVALLTIYDMCKAVDRSMNMHDIRLVKKTGGKSGDWSRSLTA